MSKIQLHKPHPSNILKSYQINISNKHIKLNIS